MSGALQHSPADILRRAMIDKGLGADPPATPWPVFADREPDRPDNVMTVFNTAGRMHGRTAPDMEMGEHYGVQVRVRAVNSIVGQAKAMAVSQSLDKDFQQKLVTINDVRYVIQTVIRTTPVIPLSEAPTTSRSVFTINAVVSLRQA